jgi:hypothetical protein
LKSICLFGLKELFLVTNVTKISVFYKTPLFRALRNKACITIQ